MLKLADGVVDIQSLFMPLAVQVVTAIMDAEVDQLCGDGANNRNGNRGRLVTCVGMLNLGVPQLWTGGFFPEGRCAFIEQKHGGAGVDRTRTARRCTRSPYQLPLVSSQVRSI